MRRVSMATRDELLAAVSERYRASCRADKKTIIDEFAATTGELVRDGLVTAVREPAYYHRRAVLVTMMKITDVGRSALEEMK